MPLVVLRKKKCYTHSDMHTVSDKNEFTKYQNNVSRLIELIILDIIQIVIT